MQKLFADLCKIDASRVLKDEPMCRHTSFRIGGPAQLVFFPAGREELIQAYALAKQQGVPVTLVGNGSNLLVRDGGIPGLTIILGRFFSEIKVSGNLICAQAGAALSRVATLAQEHGLAGLEFASGIPGSLGGGCAMNAGAYGGQLSDVLLDASVLMDKEVRLLSNRELQMGYRSTLALRTGATILGARFELKMDEPSAIAERMRELNARRREKQPLNLPSAGSFFKRPEGHFAGALIEGCKLKGARVGGAQVSEKHAGFIVNLGGATAKDVLALMEHIQSTVQSQTGIRLECEVRILGVD